jgi:hypothetical protein
MYANMMGGAGGTMRYTTMLLAVLAFSNSARGDEGFWPFGSLPIQKIEAAGGAVDANVIDKLRSASVRVGGFCSGFLAGPKGLVVTNQHCLSECLPAVSTDKNNAVTEGIVTPDPKEAQQCPGLVVEQVLNDEDITERMRAKLSGLTGEAYSAKSNELMGQEISVCQGDDQTKKCEVVTYFGDGKFRLHSYRLFDDVRVVFAPEFSAATFGGYVDNFNFPRFGFDVSILQLFKDGKPAEVPNWLKWRNTPAAPGEMLFVTGYSGGSWRNSTLAQQALMRNQYLPWYVSFLSDLRGRLVQLGAQQGGKGAAVKAALYDVENTLKASAGELQALADPTAMEETEAREKALREAIAAKPEIAAGLGLAFEEIAAAQLTYIQKLHGRRALRNGFVPSQLLNRAHSLVEAVIQYALPEAERLPDYVDGNRSNIERALFAPMTIDEEFEIAVLTFGLARAWEDMGADDAFVKALLDKRSPAALASDAVKVNSLRDPENIKAVLAAGVDALDKTNDPLLRLASIIEREYARQEKINVDEVGTPEELAMERISMARDALGSSGRYPETDGTLRLTYGSLKAVDGSDGKICTTVSELTARATDFEPYKLVPSWAEALPKLKGDMLFNCLSNHDILGGSSGSPMVDVKGEVVGIVFDGNLPSLGGAYFYDPRRNRSIMLSAPLVREAIKSVYGLNLQWE